MRSGQRSTAWRGRCRAPRAAGYIDAPRSRQLRQSPSVRRAVTGDVRLAGTPEPDPEPSPVTLYRYVGPMMKSNSAITPSRRPRSRARNAAADGAAAPGRRNGGPAGPRGLESGRSRTAAAVRTLTSPPAHPGHEGSSRAITRVGGRRSSVGCGWVVRDEHQDAKQPPDQPGAPGGLRPRSSAPRAKGRPAAAAPSSTPPVHAASRRPPPG